MPLLTIKELTIRYRGPALLDEVSCNVERKQRIGLLGRNGAGKTTLMKIISGMVESDSGTVRLENGATSAMLSQDVPMDWKGTITEVVQDGIADANTPEWEADNQVQQVLSRMQLAPDLEFSSLSSGMKRRVLLARALVNSPDLLLLDEPTNHLDIQAFRLENI